MPFAEQGLSLKASLSLTDGALRLLTDLDQPSNSNFHVETPGVFGTFQAARCPIDIDWCDVKGAGLPSVDSRCGLKKRIMGRKNEKTRNGERC